jgi:TolB-like protein
VPVPAVAPADRAGQWIIVLPLTSEGSKDPWIGKAIQQNVFTDLIQRTRAHVQSPQSEPPKGQEAALRAARDAGATYAVTGDVQSAGNELRIIGQVLDVASGTVLGGFKATGPADKLFSLEDAVAAQVLHALPTALVVVPPQQQQQPGMALQAQATQPQYQAYSQYSPPAPTYTPSTYNDYSPYAYAYDSVPYGYSSYPYYYSYPSVGFGGYFDLGGGRFNGGFGHEGFHHGFNGGFNRGFGGGIGRSSFGGFHGSAAVGHAGGGGRR